MNKITLALLILAGVSPAGAADFEGTVSMQTCSGSIVRHQSSLDDDRALVLTAGHCIESDEAPSGRYLANIASSRSFDVLDADGETQGTVHAERILYSTITKTDATLYRLRETYRDIHKKFGVRPFELAVGHPALKTRIDVISGYLQNIYSCSVEAFAYRLKEKNWMFHDAIRYGQPGCEIGYGSSGSPVVARGTRVVIGVNNTVNFGSSDCSADNACEFDAEGRKSIHAGAAYAQQSFWISSCFNSSREFDLSVTGCALVW